MQGDPARLLIALFIHDYLQVSMVYSGNSKSGLNKTGIKDREKEESALSKIVMTEVLEERQEWKGQFNGCHHGSNFSKVNQDFAQCQ